ncbi:Putative uncharacterized protein [Propionibacterium freudenreichii subsp. freudenreichii]|uniref:Uncharacterized protein n=1 Tax=Propionibacterium freudenreichii subsp. freudenreichii TaxID=66712 RepID=A0A0B7NYC9_PROFF|nr:Putative uncharacterized protein [Propionibacterium freudenreichii subsp. freudenreichii]
MTMAVNSLKLAVKRWRDTTSQKGESVSDPDLVRFASIGEALQWAGSLDDHWSQHYKRQEHRTTSTCCNQTLEGLRFARNRVVHDLIITASGHDGMMFPLVFPLCFGHYEWRPARDLPLPTDGPGSGKEGERQKDAYENCWQGEDVERTLDALVSHFEELSRLK